MSKTDFRAQCSRCYDQFCVSARSKTAEYCPAEHLPEVYREAENLYRDEETRRIARAAAIVEATGYIVWPRLRDIIEFARLMDYCRIGLVFCPDLWREAKHTGRILAEQGFAVVSRVCRMTTPAAREGRYDLDSLAKELANLEIDYLIVGGLCAAAETRVGRTVRKPVTTFIARDERHGNYPALELYTGPYWRDWAQEVYAKRRTE